MLGYLYLNISDLFPWQTHPWCCLWTHQGVPIRGILVVGGIRGGRGYGGWGGSARGGKGGGRRGERLEGGGQGRAGGGGYKGGQELGSRGEEGEGDPGLTAVAIESRTPTEKKYY